MKPTLNVAPGNPEKHESAFRRVAYTRTEMKAIEQDLINRKEPSSSQGQGTSMEQVKQSRKGDKDASSSQGLILN